MADSTLRVEVPGFDASAIAREAIAAKLTEALVGADDAVRAIVVAAMAQKVGGNGVVHQYPSENKIPFVEWLAQDLIREATKKVLQEKVERLRPALEVAIEAQLKKNTKSIAVALTENFIKHASYGYGVIINMTAEVRQKD